MARSVLTRVLLLAALLQLALAGRGLKDWYEGWYTSWYWDAVNPCPTPPSPCPSPVEAPSPVLPSPAPIMPPSPIVPDVPSPILPPSPIVPPPPPPVNSTNICDAVNATSYLSTLSLMIQSLKQGVYAQNITDLCNSNITLFAPADTAFGDFVNQLQAVNTSTGPMNATRLLKNETIMFAILATHIVPQYYPFANLVPGLTLLAELEGVTLTIANDTGSTVVVSPGSNGTITQPDVNGYALHVVNAVLLPAALEGLVSLLTDTPVSKVSMTTTTYDALVSSGNFNQLIACVNKVSDAAATNAQLTNYRQFLQSTTIQLTMFAPTDEAITNDPRINAAGGVAGADPVYLNKLLGAHFKMGPAINDLYLSGFTSWGGQFTQIVHGSAAGASTAYALQNPFTLPGAAVNNVEMISSNQAVYGCDHVLYPSN